MASFVNIAQLKFINLKRKEKNVTYDVMQNKRKKGMANHG
jgi:hypothetical protein